MKERDNTQVELARALCRALFEAFDASDWDAIRRICAPDIVVLADTDLQGHDALIRYLTEIHRHFPGIRTDTHDIACSDGHVVFENNYLAPSGASWKLGGRGCTVLVVRDDVIVELRTYYMPAPDDFAGKGTVMTPQVAEEQAALRRVSTLVARGGEPDEVFAAVNREVGLLVGADATSLFQFHDDDTMRLVSVWCRDNVPVSVGDRRRMNAPMLELRRTAAPVRFEPLPEGVSFLEEARAYGVETAIGLPLIVEDAVWGVVFAVSKMPGLLRPDAEQRARRFTSLAEIALAHSRARASLTRSRARVLAAADASRHQVQRDLHDGAQQRLVHAAVELQRAREAAATHDCTAAGSIDQALDQTKQANAELRDLVRGILPAALTRHGIRAAVNSLVDHLPLQVAIHGYEGRLPTSVETTAYFVIAEALTNAAKYAEVESAEVHVIVGEGDVVLEVRDGGVGGARWDRGTGLSGLADRAAAHGGTVEVFSPPGGGTTVRTRIPISKTNLSLDAGPDW